MLDLLWIPRDTVHSFNVTSDVGHLLNGYIPGAFRGLRGRNGQPGRTFKPQDQC